MTTFAPHRDTVEAFIHAMHGGADTDALTAILADDVVLYKTPFTFDVSVWELLWALGRGARLVIAKPGGHRDPAYLRELIISRGITVLHFVPSMLDVYTEVLANEGHSTLLPATVRFVFTSGEALPRSLAERVIDVLAANPTLTDAQEEELVELRRSCFGSADFREGIRAFAEKRRPTWTGK